MCLNCTNKLVKAASQLLELSCPLNYRAWTDQVGYVLCATLVMLLYRASPQMQGHWTPTPPSHPQNHTAILLCYFCTLREDGSGDGHYLSFWKYELNIWIEIWENASGMAPFWLYPNHLIYPIASKTIMCTRSVLLCCQMPLPCHPEDAELAESC